jgi:hypothetical protein
VTLQSESEDMADIIARIDALLANTPQSEIEEFEVTRCLRDCRDELIAATACAEMMLQGTGQRLAESMAERVMNGMTVGVWVDVVDRLPPIAHCSTQSSKDVFVATPYAGGEFLLAIGYYSHADEVWRIRGAQHGWKPTHWMPLPEPPESK